MKFLTCAIIFLFLAACSPNQPWKDITGQNRGFDEMRADEIDCFKAADDWQTSTGIELRPDGVVNRRALCMMQKGWIRPT
ncbi:MAG: hypothetical protein JSR55_04465 [Proteobacteria bacterium]|nr:hypothetical protein [Pseudomonadota bacterium]